LSMISRHECLPPSSKELRLDFVNISSVENCHQLIPNMKLGLAARLFFRKSSEAIVK
jgi:hypothetical protein